MRRLLFGGLSVAVLVSTILLLWPTAVSTQSAPTVPVNPSLERLGKFWSHHYGVDPGYYAHYLNAVDYQVVAKAKPDQCHYGLLDPRNQPSFDATYPGNLTLAQREACIDDGGQLKTNQAYVWGLTRSGHELWFGTIANTLCLVMDGFYPSGTFAPYQNSAWACEMGGRDARPPRIFNYDTWSGRLTDLTSQVVSRGGDDLARLQSTIGLRSAGAHEGVVFFGGIGRGAVNLFAFNAWTHQYIGSYSFDGNDGRPRYSNIRQWIVAKGELYTGVGKRGGGAVLRWIGDVSDPFQFETVGDLLGDPAYLVEYKGRIASSTWGGPPDSGGFVIYMSPRFGVDQQLNAADASNWSIVWKLSQYEVEPTAVQMGGAIAVEGDSLIWGTMCVPLTGLFEYQRAYPGAPVDAAAFLGTYRPITIFRGHHLETASPRVDVLYGNTMLPQFDSGTNEWHLVVNNMGQVPVMGLSGFGNFFNNYTWWMQSYQGALLVGTMDWLYVGARFADPFLAQIPEEIRAVARRFEGADIWVFGDDHSSAVPITLSGAGNIANYGIRTMVTVNDHLYFGSANPMNLLTSGPTRGGWELIKAIVK